MLDFSLKSIVKYLIFYAILAFDVSNSAICATSCASFLIGLYTGNVLFVGDKRRHIRVFYTKS